MARRLLHLWHAVYLHDRSSGQSCVQSIVAIASMLRGVEKKSIEPRPESFPKQNVLHCSRMLTFLDIWKLLHENLEDRRRILFSMSFGFIAAVSGCCHLPCVS